MKKGSNVQRSPFSLRLGSESTKLSGSLLVSALCWLAVACSATISDPGVDDGTPNGGDAGGSSNGTPSGGRSSGNNGSGGSQNGKPQGGGSSQSAGGNGSGNSGSGSNTGSGNNTGAGNSTGNAGSGNATGSGGTPGVAIPSALPTPSACTTPNTAGPRALRRLSEAEFKASVGDLFGDRSVPITEVFNDQRVLGFSVDNNALVVQGLNADQLMANAEAVADWAVKGKLSQITTCQTKDESCGKQFIKAFLRKAFRRAVQDSEVTSYYTLFNSESTFTDAATSVVTAVLQSPNFLYRSELGTGTTGSTTLTAYEVANSLSYLLTGTSPDNELMTAADNAQSASQIASMVDSHATRLLAKDAAKDAFMNFVSGWVGLDRLPSAVKSVAFDDSVRADMATETRLFLLNLFGSSGKVADLFSAKYTFVNQNLANFYGLSYTGGGGFQNTPINGSQRDGGLLAHGSILTGYARADLSSPTQRGHLVRSRLLCQDVPPPPAGLDTKFQPTDAAKTTRDHYLLEHATPQRSECYGCHKLMDPIGFAFEHYDTVGKWRAQENGVTINATGTIYSASVKDGDISLDGLGPLQAYLASSDELKSCLVRYWSYYAFGTSSWSQDACTYDAVKAQAAKTDFKLQDVLLAIVKSPRFTKRDQ